MKLLTTHFIIVILIVTDNKFINCQFANGRRQKHCITKTPPQELPFYPCLNSNYTQKDKKCNGKFTKNVGDCLDCVERNSSIPFPYPHLIPPCKTECPAGLKWCEPQQKCIDQNEDCDCGPDLTYCTYIDKDKTKHINGVDVFVHGTTEKYRCFTAVYLERRINRNEFEICPDGSCKETYMNCSASTVSSVPRIVNHSTDGVDSSSTNKTEDKITEKSVNSTTTDESSPSSLGLSVGLSFGFVLLLGIAWASAVACYCRVKRKQDETMWVDDNPDYGEVEDYDEATVVTDVNDYYGKDDDSEEETALVDLNDNYGRLTVSVGNRDARLEFIEEVSSEDNDDEKENQRESVFYDEVSQKSQENDYD